MAGPVDWALAERVAIRVSGTEPFARSYHWASLGPDLIECTERAEALVAAETGLRSLAGPARARVTDRAGWIRANVASFQRLLRPLLEKLDERIGGGPLAPIAKRAAGIELGLVLGWMSTRVLGQYDLLVVEEESPHEQDIVYYVGPNILALEKAFAFPPRQFRQWIALHEVTHRAQFTGVPWLRPHFLGLVQQLLADVDPDPEQLVDGLRRAVGSLRGGAGVGDVGTDAGGAGLMSMLASPAQQQVLASLSGLMSLLEGHGDVTMDRAGEDLVPSAARFGRVLRQRRTQAKGVTRIMQRLIGLEAKLAQYEQGERFIAEVELDGGPALLARVWEDATHLPTIEEIRAPADWVARIRAVGPAA